MFEKLYPQSEIKVLLISISLHLIFWVSPFLSISKTKLYVEMDDFVPDFETASNLVREAGGLVFIPHIYEYKKNSENLSK